MGQMIPITLPADGNWPTIVGDSIMIIGPRQNELTEEQRYFNPVYLMTYPGKEHLKAQMIRAGACDCDPTKPNRCIGVFSVAPDKKVSFSQGNLQYLPAINLWKFANTQYEYLGNANKYLKPTFRNWVDLFGWSANNTTAPFGVSTSTNVADYAGEFVDWGTNTICGEAPGTWRTLSADEWEYLFEKRKNALQLRSKGSIDGHRGHILLPDDWVLPEGVQFVAEPDNLTMELDINTYTPAEWSIMEEAGAVFLPAAGRRDGTTVGYLVEYSGVWSSTSTTNTNAFHTYYNYDSQIIEHHWTSATSRINGRSVRLVHDTIVLEAEPEYVDLGLSVKWATFNVGATSPEDYGDYFAWGETETKETYSWATYKWCDGTSTNMTKYNTEDGKTILEPTDDAAQVQWGGKWRMPTEEEQQELIDRCSWERTNLNGVIGYKVTGPNGNSIFIPIAGAYNSFDNQLNSVGSIGWIYSSTKATGTRAYEIHIEEGVIQQKDCSRCVGLTIRPVYDDRPPKRIGVFSVAADKQVSFSQGNLQYVQSTDEWRFAREQYEYIGAANIKDGALADKIDLFGWSADNTTAPFGVSTSTNDADYTGEFMDWGTNTICGEAPGTWRTLSADEWEYLLKKRKNASDLYGVAQVAGVNGMIILPDVWEEANGIVFKSGLHSSQVDDYSVYQSFTDAQWLAMENAGAVFLPALGYRDGTNVEKCNTSGYYWSNTTSDEKSAYRLYFYSYFLAPNDVHSKYRGRSVRLVHDTIVPKVEPEYVDLGLSVKWATFNVGATSPEDYGDYFAWGETETKDKYSWATYKWCDGTSTNMTKYNTEDGKTVLDLDDDAAYVNWGDKWRMPTKEECQELLDKCTWKEETRNGINGHIVTGPNGNSIFIPTTGYHNDDNGTGVQGLGTITYLWTSSTPGNANAYDLLLSHPTLADGIGSNTRRVGMPIRPVYDDRPPKRIGVFSVAADKQVSFSQGNLQYIQSTKEWLFAENQWDFIGEKNIYSGVIADKIDFFGWSTNNPQSLWGLIFTQSNVYYSGTFVDWGNNLIMGDLANTWRTLSLNEWTYLLRQRENANNLYTYANINGTNGLVLLPDKWEAIDEIPISIATDYSANTFSFSQWETLEAKGAVFLPSCGVYMGNNYNHETAGLYWTNTPDESDETKSHCLYVTKRYVDINYSGNRSTNRSVRLVHDTIVPKPEPEYVDLGLSVKWATFNVGATSPNEIGNFYAWGEIETKDTYTVNNYKWWNKTSKETTKYCTIDSLAYGGVADGLTELQPQDDIAHILKGEHWRMPDLDECKELGNGCTWTVSTRQGQIGFEGISKINGNTIFLPVVGFRAGVNLVHETLGGYWSSTLNIEKQSCAMGLYLNRETPSVGIYYNSSRQNGFLIRPVYDEMPDPCLVVKVNDTLSINLMCVEGGTFMMGSDAPDAQADEQPVHEVTLSDYYIGQTEVTQHLWKAVMGSGNNPSATKGNNLPVTDITWDETQQFVERLSELTGLRFRLPTEAEWEYAARGGQRSKGYTYAGSNDIDQVGWYNVNSSNKTHIVGQKQPNELGIYDMTGNVWEYCYDWHTPYAAQAQTNPTGAATGDKHVLRGGCYHYDSKNCTNTNRHSYYTPDKGGASTGLRIVLEP